MASDITTLNIPRDNNVYGMDHKAITWCHQLLVTVRSVIDVTSKLSTQNISTRTNAIKDVLFNKNDLLVTKEADFKSSAVDNERRMEVRLL